MRKRYFFGGLTLDVTLEEPWGFRELLPEHVSLVDGNAGTVRELIRRLKERNLLEKQTPSIEYYYSGRRVQDKEELHRLESYLQRLGCMHALT